MDAATKLALQAAAGDRAALDAWIELSYRPVWRYCATITDTDRADELAQDTFEKALRALTRFRGRSTATTWLIGIARHVCIDQLRAAGRRERAHQQIASLSTPTHTSDTADRTALLDMIGQLEHDRREAFVLTQLLGLSYQEAATICSCPIGTIRSRVARARTDLLTSSEQAEHTKERETGSTT